MRGTVRDYMTKTQGRKWRIIYDLPPDPETGERRQTTKRGFATKDEADRALRKVLNAVDDDEYVEPSTVTVGKWLTHWLDTKLNIRETTRARYRQSIECHLNPRIGGIRLQQLRTEHLDRCYRNLLEEGGRSGDGLAPKTVRNAHGVIRTALEAAVQRRHVIRNVADNANLPDSDKSEMRYWTTGQLRRFLDHVSGLRLHAMWLLFTTTGMRRGEVLGLRWDALDLDAGRLTVKRNLTVVDGRPIEQERAKTAAGRRTLGLDPATVAALRKHRAGQAEERMAAGLGAIPDDGLVFCWEDGSLIHPHRPTRWMREMSAELGLPHIRLHGLRHSYATAALQAGVDVKVLSTRLGHANTTITRDLYQHVMPEMDQDAADTVAASILGS